MPFILIAVLIDMVSIGIIIPVLPVLVGTFTGSQADQAFWFGIVAFSFGIANFFGSPVLGALSDRFGRRPVMLIGFCGLAVSFFGTALATSLWMLVVVRLFSGAMQSNIAVANAYVADITAPADKARRFGLLGSMFGLGFILGPVVGGLLGEIDLRLPFFAAGSLALLNFVYGVLVLPESLPLDRRRAFEWRRANPVASLRTLRALKGVGPLVVALALAGLAQFTMHMSWVLYTSFKFGWGPLENGWSLMAVGAMSMLVQGLLMKPLLARFSPQRLATMGMFSWVLCFLGWGLAGTGWVMFAVIGLNLFGFAANASLQSIVSNAADAHTQGQTMGAVASLNSMAAVLAPLIASTLLGFVAHLPQGSIGIGLPLFFCAAVQALACAIAVRHFNRERALRVAAATTA